MLSRVLSGAVLGIDAYRVDVEVDVTARGLPTFTMVGLPDAAVKESKDRVRTALKNNGFSFPLKKIVINFAPADIKKEGSSFDLPIAVGIIAAEGLVGPEALEGVMLTGELSLDGAVKQVNGVLPMAILARDMGIKCIVVPKENAREAAVVEDVRVYGVDNLVEVVDFLRGEHEPEQVRVDVEALFGSASFVSEDFSDVKGQEHVKRAIEVAAAGGHNIIMIGPPGSGKTMLARRIPGVLPDMGFEEAIETTKIHSVVGRLTPENPLVVVRPFRDPHHTISSAGLIGGGAYPRPGEASLAHNGVLFLDELPEFERGALEVLRQPLEDRHVTIARAAMSMTYPASFMLVAAMNPCPCGYHTDPRHTCRCTPRQIERYRTKISGPLLDRIDLHVEVPAVEFRELADDRRGEPSETVRARVNTARQAQTDRFGGDGVFCNSQMKPAHIRKHCKVPTDVRDLLEGAMERLGFSARAYNRILKVSRTIADLEGSPEISAAHVSEAIQYRSLDRKLI